MVTLPPLPEEHDEEWFDRRNSFDLAIKGQIEGRLSEETLDNRFLGKADHSVQDVVETGRLSEAALAETFAPITYVRDIRDFLLPGEKLETTFASSITVLLDRAVAALNAEYVAQTPSSFSGGKIGYVLAFPGGTFRVVGTPVWRSGVGIRGAGRNDTVFLPVGASRFVRGSMPGDVYAAENRYTDCSFSDFTVDCSQQVWGGAYESSLKPFYLQGCLRLHMARITIRDSWATAFGNDFLYESVYVDCVSVNAGRGARQYAITREGTGAGFGWATGFDAGESIRIVNCSSSGSWSAGFFSELNWVRGALTRSPRNQIIGCSAWGNYVGIRDAGSLGMSVIGGEFSDNEFAGMLVSDTASTEGRSGAEGIISGATFARNRHGIVFGTIGATGLAVTNGYRASGCSIFENLEYGVWLGQGGAPSRDIAVINNSITRNGGAGVLIGDAAGAGRATRPVVRGNTIRGNGHLAASAFRDGVTVTTAADKASIVDNIIIAPTPSDAGFSALAAVAFRNIGTGVSISPTVRGNDANGYPDDFIDTQSIVDTAAVTGNRLIDARTLIAADDANRANGPLGSTPIGSVAWAVSGSAYVGAVIDGRLGFSAAHSTNRGYATLNAGAADHQLLATISNPGTNRRGGLVVRWTSDTDRIALAPRVSASDTRYQVTDTVAGVGTTTILPIRSMPGDRIAIIANDDHVLVFINGYLAGDIKVGAHAGTRAGFYLGNGEDVSTARWDDVALYSIA